MGDESSFSVLPTPLVWLFADRLLLGRGKSYLNFDMCYFLILQADINSEITIYSVVSFLTTYVSLLMLFSVLKVISAIFPFVRENYVARESTLRTSDLNLIDSWA